MNDLATALRLTDNAVRAHLLKLEREGLIHQAGMQPGFRRPHVTFGLTPAAEQVFPRAYGSLLDLFLTVFAKKLSPNALRAALREVGGKAADDHLVGVEGKSRPQRLEAALRILKEMGGSATLHESEGKHFIRGNGCPLAAVTGRHPEACLIAESLLTQIIDAPVKERCIHGAVPSCRFQVG